MLEFLSNSIDSFVGLKHLLLGFHKGFTELPNHIVLLLGWAFV